jgi:hypothetical protein
MAVPPKTCARCGRTIAWRKAWSRCWHEIRFCSAWCKRPPRDTDHRLEAAILALLASRARDATICPSEAARLVGGEQWRAEMEPARQAARRLVAHGLVVIKQRGRIVDPSTARGAIRIARVDAQQ